MRVNGRITSVNLVYLENICGNDQQFIKEVITQFLSQIPQFLTDIEEALGNADRLKMASVAHKLKSSAQFMGAQELCDFSFELEQLCNSEHKIDLLHIEEQARKMLLEFEKVKTDLLKLTI